MHCQSPIVRFSVVFLIGCDNLCKYFTCIASFYKSLPFQPDGGGWNPDSFHNQVLFLMLLCLLI